MATASLKHRFSSDQFLRMAEAGIFPPDARIELLDGEIVPMSPIGPKHAYVLTLIHELLSQSVLKDWQIREQQPVALFQFGMPQADICIVRRSRHQPYQHPIPSDIGLLIEVADSSLELDTGPKRALYAANAIPEYWVVDLVHATVEQSIKPGPTGYGSTHIHGLADSVAATVVNGLSVPVSALFPPEACGTENAQVPG